MSKIRTRNAIFGYFLMFVYKKQTDFQNLAELATGRGRALAGKQRDQQEQPSASAKKLLSPANPASLFFIAEVGRSKNQERQPRPTNDNQRATSGNPQPATATALRFHRAVDGLRQPQACVRYACSSFPEAPCCCTATALD